MSKPHTIIIGAGLAGCHLAYELSRHNFDITLIDRHPNFAEQASRNYAAITYPTVSATPLAVSDLAVEGWKYLYEILKEMPETRHKVCGALKLLQTEEEKIRWTRAIKNHGLSSDWMEAVDKKNACAISGINIDDDAIYLKRAAWVDIPDYCKHLIKNSKNIKVLSSTEVIDFGSGWIKTSTENKIYADQIVFCGAYEISKLPKLSWIPFRTVRGQLATFKTLLPALKTILCFNGLATPDLGNSSQQIGATYSRESKDITSTNEDTLEIITKLKAALPSEKISLDSAFSKCISTWSQLRTNIPGMEPLIGSAFLESGEEIKNVSILTAFSSKGLVYIPSSSRYLAKQIATQIRLKELERFSGFRLIKR